MNLLINNCKDSKKKLVFHYLNNKNFNLANMEHCTFSCIVSVVVQFYNHFD